MNNAVFGNVWKMWEDIEISNLYQPKRDGLTYWQSQTIT